MDDYSKAGSASEYGLLTNSAFAVYPDGGSPVPVDFSLNSMTYDTILLGSEIAGGGFGAGNAYSGEVIVVAPVDTTAPVITLLGDSKVTIQKGEVYEDAGAEAMDDTDGDLSNAIEVEGEDFDSNVPGIYKITYNVTDTAGNKAVEVEREVVVEDSVQPEPDTTAPVITLNGDACLLYTSPSPRD